MARAIARRCHGWMFFVGNRDPVTVMQLQIFALHTCGGILMNQRRMPITGTSARPTDGAGPAGPGTKARHDDHVRFGCSVMEQSGVAFGTSGARAWSRP
jgi:hypothetical protein